MKEGWKCPACGKAHGPHIDTCPEVSLGIPAPYPGPSCPPIFWDGPRPQDGFGWWPYEVTCGDPPGTVGVGSTQVVDPVSGKSFGPSD